jgi:hypothetical protein
MSKDMQKNTNINNWLDQLLNPSNWRKTSNLPMFIIIALALKLSTLEAQ